MIAPIITNGGINTRHSDIVRIMPNRICERTFAAFMQNTIESYYGAKILFRDWVPQAYIDHHQMGAYSARLYVPPYSNPFRPNADPLVWREMSWYGAHIAYKEEEAGWYNR